MSTEQTAATTENNGRPTKKFWMVVNTSGRSPRKRHMTLAAALAEAQRIAHLEPGRRLYVLEALGYAATPAVPAGSPPGPIEVVQLPDVQPITTN